MAEMENNFENEEFAEGEAPIIPLTDEETGEEKDFEILGTAELEGVTYFALVPADEEESEFYYIYRVIENGDEMILEEIEDDEEFARAENHFDEMFREED